MIVCIISLTKWEKDDQIPEPKMKISRGLAVFHNCIEVLFKEYDFVYNEMFEEEFF